MKEAEMHIVADFMDQGIQLTIEAQKKTSKIEHDKTEKWPVPSAKTQIGLGIHAVWSESLPCTGRRFESLATHKVH